VQKLIINVLVNFALNTIYRPAGTNIATLIHFVAVLNNVKVEIIFNQVTSYLIIIIIIII
jgi:hypothetical protein